MIDPWPKLLPAPLVHADLASPVAPAVADEAGAAPGVEVTLGQVGGFCDSKPRPPEHDDQGVYACAMNSRSGLAHHGDDLLHPRRVGRVARAPVPWRASGVVAGKGRGRSRATCSIERLNRRHWSSFVEGLEAARESGLVVDQRIPTVWTVRGGRVVQVRAYRDEAEALEAAGMREWRHQDETWRKGK